MNIPLFCLCLVLCVLLAFTGWNWLRTEIQLQAVRMGRVRLEDSIRNNLRAIRAHVAYGFPEACAVCDALEAALPRRDRIDFQALEHRLIALRRAHNAALLDAAKTGEPYRSALRELLALLTDGQSSWAGNWEELEKFDRILSGPPAERKGGAA